MKRNLLILLAIIYCSCCLSSYSNERLFGEGENLASKKGRQFEIIRFLGEGTFGQVYLAYSLTHHKLVALKFYTHYGTQKATGSEEAGFYKMFKGIVKTADWLETLFKNKGKLFAKQEKPDFFSRGSSYKKGEVFFVVEADLQVPKDLGSLKDNFSLGLGEKNPVEIQKRVDRLYRIFTQGVEALNALASEGLRLNDIKPENIMLGYGDGRKLWERDIKIPAKIIMGLLDEGSFGVKFADFDLAEGLGGANAGDAFLAGTPGYLAPEKYRNKDSLSNMTDHYSFAATMLDLMIEGEVTRFMESLGGELDSSHNRMLQAIADPAYHDNYQGNVRAHFEALTLHVEEVNKKAGVDLDTTVSKLYLMADYVNAGLQQSADARVEQMEKEGFALKGASTEIAITIRADLKSGQKKRDLTRMIRGYLKSCKF